MDYKYKIGEKFILSSKSPSWDGILVELVEYQKYQEHCYVVTDKQRPETRYGATEECLRRPTKLDKALR